MEVLTTHPNASWSRRPVLCLLLLWMGMAGAPSFLQTASAAEYTEYELKAGYLYQLALFIDWPQARFANAKSPIVIGVLGEDPFKKDLEKTIEGEKVNNRPVVLKRYKRPEDAREAHILFIAASEKKHWPEILEKLKGSRILTVSDVEGFC